jgi:hypothetical protein
VHKVVRYKDKTHLRALLGTEILRAAETMYGDLKPRTVIY